jgi:hypothetical protein
MNDLPFVKSSRRCRKGQKNGEIPNSPEKTQFEETHKQINEGQSTMEGRAEKQSFKIAP